MEGSGTEPYGGAPTYPPGKCGADGRMLILQEQQEAAEAAAAEAELEAERLQRAVDKAAADANAAVLKHAQEQQRAQVVIHQCLLTSYSLNGSLHCQHEWI